MTKNPKVLLVASECAPIVKIGDIGDMVGGLSKELQNNGIDARVILPLYKTVDVKKFNIKPLWRERRLKIKKGTHGIGLWSGTLPGSSVPVYFIENKKFLGSGDVYFSNPIALSSRAKKTSQAVRRKKEVERFVFFSDVIHSLLKEKLLPFLPDVIHANDWHTGELVAQLANSKLQIAKQKKKNKKKKKRGIVNDVKVENDESEIKIPKVIFTIHNIANQGTGNGKNYLKEGIENADIVTTVSSTHAEEIKDKEQGFGLHVLLRKKKPHGILNGFDYGYLTSFGEKDAHKLSFQVANNLKTGAALPIFSMIAPLHDHKGIQWVIPVVSYVVELFDAQFVFLGKGEEDFEEALFNLAKRYPQNVLVKFDADDNLTSSTYAASDFLLLPSSYEPCGSGQVIAMSYGTLPIARATGGLAETVKDGKTGFIFEAKNAKALLRAMERALMVFVDEESLGRMRELALAEDFNWEKPMAAYTKLYRQPITND